MRVHVYPADQWACGHYRMIWPAKVLQDQGMDVTIIEPGSKTGVGGWTRRGKMVRPFLPETDVLVLQRPSNTLLADLVPLARQKGVAVVVDIDDDLERIHPRNIAFHNMHPRTNPTNNWSHVTRACRAATLVTCSTPALADRYGAHGRVRVLFNYVPRRFLDIDHHDVSSFGWAGSLHSHPDDLPEAGGAIERLVREGHRFQVIGPPNDVAATCRIGHAPGDWSATGDLEFDQWIPNVTTLGVGLAPLADTSFNAAKSWLKPLEYAAAGVPWVASDRPEYRRLARMCGAPLVTKPKQWYGEVKSLLADPGRRCDLSVTGRLVASTLTIEEHAHEWAEAWSEAYHRERRRVTV